MGNYYSTDDIAEDHIHTDITCNTEEPQQKYHLGMMLPKAIDYYYKGHKANYKYEILLKLALYFHRKCHLKFFMNGCHGNQSCHAIFIKTSYM